MPKRLAKKPPESFRSGGVAEPPPFSASFGAEPLSEEEVEQSGLGVRRSWAKESPYSRSGDEDDQ